MFIEILTVLVIIAALGFAVFYYVKQMKPAKEYVWVGPGEDPFKKKAEEEEEEYIEV